MPQRRGRAAPEAHQLLPDWHAFLDDFQAHWPTSGDNTYVDFVRDGIHGNGAARSGDARWRRLTEHRARGAKSVFHFDVQGSVAKSTHAGIPWLRFIRDRLGSTVHFWPFDGWQIPPGRSAIAEVYPELSPPEAMVARVEGWMLGAPGQVGARLRTPVQDGRQWIRLVRRGKTDSLGVRPVGGAVVRRDSRNAARIRNALGRYIAIALLVRRRKPPHRGDTAPHR